MVHLGLFFWCVCVCGGGGEESKFFDNSIKHISTYVNNLLVKFSKFKIFVYKIIIVTIILYNNCKSLGDFITFSGFKSILL